MIVFYFRRISSPTIASKIPVPVSTTSKGAFRFFTDDDRPVPAAQPPLSVPESTQPSNQITKQVSPFTPITHSKPIPSFKKSTSSAGNTPSAKTRRAQLPISDDDDEDEEEEEEEDSEANNLKEADLKLKLKEQKRHGKQTGELLNKLHENYEELLEKYAQAENTIDQLRFQPKIFGDNTPPSNASEVKLISNYLLSHHDFHRVWYILFNNLRSIPQLCDLMECIIHHLILPCHRLDKCLRQRLLHPL